MPRQKRKWSTFVSSTRCSLDTGQVTERSISFLAPSVTQALLYNKACVSSAGLVLILTSVLHCGQTLLPIMYALNIGATVVVTIPLLLFLRRNRSSFGR